MDLMSLTRSAMRTRKKLLRFYLFVSLLGICLVTVRYFLGTDKAFLFLLWNFFLALIPLLMSSVLIQMSAAGSGRRPMIIMGLFWLLFLPNAPYMMTDYIHLRYGSREFLLFDWLILTWFAVPAFIAAIISLNDIAGLLQKRYRGFQVSALIFIVCLMCSFGIYLGRDLRFNSWDLVMNPGAVVSESMEHLRNPWADFYTWVGATAIGLLLFVTYQGLRMMRRLT